MLSSCVTPVDVGQISGTIRLEPAPQSVLDFLNGNPAQPGQVTATNTANTSQVATANYSVAAGTLPPALAQYTINPNVDAGGSTFAMRVDELRLQNGARYRFGTRQPTSPGALISPVVVPSGQQTFDIKECPALARITARVTGPAPDLDALDEVVACTAAASVKENPASAQGDPQATSAPVITSRTTLRNEGVSIPILVRAGQPVQFTAACLFTTSQPGFPQNPALQEGQVAFGGTASQLDVACGDEPQVQIEIPVERSVGTLKGLLDVVGQTESQIRIDLTTAPGFSSTQNVAGNTPPHAWQFDGVPSGQHTVSANALLDNGNAMLRFPNLIGPDRAQVTAGVTTDLGSRFVAVPFTVQGNLSLRDPRAGTRLAHLVLDPLSSFSVPPPTTFLKAEGDPNFSSFPGANGTGALSFAKFNGSFDSVAQRWGLNAALPLVGLSLASGSPSGADTLPAPWKVTSFGVQLSEPNAFQESLNVKLNLSNLFNSTPNGQATLPPVDACFGEFALTLQAPPNFTLFAPRLDLDINDSTLQQSQDDDGAFLLYDSASGTSTTAPFAEANAASSVNVSMALPAFLRYRLKPQVKLRNQATSQVTTVTLAKQDVPPNGMIQCGGLFAPCTRLDDAGGTVSTLSAQVLSPAASCDPSNVQLTIAAASTGDALQSVALTIDNQPPVEVCGATSPCQNPLLTGVPLGAVTPGQHTVTVTATSLSCLATSQRPITVVERPQLLCRPPVVVQLFPGETQVPFERVSERLQAAWSGTCQGSVLPPIQNDHPADFPLGTTTVRFFSEPNNTPAGEQQCQTTVTVLPPDGCNTFQSVPFGNLAGPTVVGGVEYTPISGQISRVTDQFPPNQPDGQRELEIGAVEAKLPFAARWVRLQYVKAHSMPIKVDGFDDSNQLVQTWQSPAGEAERQRFTRVITGPPRRTLRISAQGGEDLLLGICYSLSLPPGPQPGQPFIQPNN
jgi:hypothetical protein